MLSLLYRKKFKLLTVMRIHTRRRTQFQNMFTLKEPHIPSLFDMEEGDILENIAVKPLEETKASDSGSNQGSYTKWHLAICT